MTPKIILLLCSLLAIHQSSAMGMHRDEPLAHLYARPQHDNHRHQWQTSPLRKAISLQNVQQVKQLITDGADINEKGLHCTALWALISARDSWNEQDIIDIIKLAVKKGANLNAPGCAIEATILHQLTRPKDASLMEICI